MLPTPGTEGISAIALSSVAPTSVRARTVARVGGPDGRGRHDRPGR
jgi:hypothetical protein